nr:60S ribosomal protein L34 [Tanacetum cinerariifolium]
MRLTVNFHHDGNFVQSPLMYQEGDESTIHDIDFEGMTVARYFFLVHGKQLSNGLIQIKNNLDLANCIAIGYKNGKVIDMFLEHHGYDLSHWIQTDINNNDDEISDVEMEDITGYAVSDFVGEDDVVIPNRDLAKGRSDGKKGKKGDWPYKKEKDEDKLPKKDKGKLLRAPKKASIRKKIERLKHSQRYWAVYPCGDNVFEVRKGDDAYGVNIDNRTCACKLWDLSGVPCVHSVAAFSFLKNDPILGPSVGDPSSAGPSVADSSSAGPSVADPSSACPSVADSSSAGPSVADSTGSGTQTITEDPIVADPTDDIPTQQSKTSDTAKIIEDAIATGRLKTAGLKRRCKSERIAKRAKAFQFGKDGAGSCPNKAWDVDDVLAEK